MKTLYTVLAAIFLITNCANAYPVDKVTVNGGNWSNPATWTLGRIPQNGDSIVIPSFYSLTLDISETLNDVYIMVQGSLALNKTSLTLDAQSSVQILFGGWLYGSNFSSLEKITIGGVVKFTGNGDFLVLGPNTANKNTATSPNGFASNPVRVILPVTFTAFTADLQNDNTALISWSTTDEMNNGHFEIEKSLDGTDWQVIGTVLPGNNPQINTYQYTDNIAGNGTVYYRIRQVDLDGKYMYSIIATVKATGLKATASIFSAGKNVNIRLNGAVKNRVTVRLISMNGQVLRQQTFDAPPTMITFTPAVSDGAYAVQVTDGNGLIEAKIVIL
jgi:hypothetical protein